MSEREWLHRAGFGGFVTIRDLRASSLAEVPGTPGVYVVLRDSVEPPSFRERSTGGHFKGRDPAVPVDRLKAKWVTNTAVLYIGKAGGVSGPPTLRARLRQYLSFGSGKPVGHWGGRYIWQLTDAEDLIICWLPCPGKDPPDIEQLLLKEFLYEHRRLPFANLRR